MLFIQNTEQLGRDVLFNELLNTFYSYPHVVFMIKAYTDHEVGNLLPPLFYMHKLIERIIISKPLLHQLWGNGWKRKIIGPLRRFDPATEAHQTSILLLELHPATRIWVPSWTLQNTNRDQVVMLDKSSPNYRRIIITEQHLFIQAVLEFSTITLFHIEINL